MTSLENSPPSDKELDGLAEKHLVKVQLELSQQHAILRKQAQGIFAAIKGRRGARSEEYWQEIFALAKVDFANGKFIVERLGADRQLDLPLVATLTQLRCDLLEGIENPTAGDYMLADSAILAYRNLLRIQGWIGSTAFVVQRELFGQEPLETSYGYTEAMAIERRVEQLERALMPLLDRSQKMLIRALDRLQARRSGSSMSAISIGKAGQVNIGGAVNN